MPSEGLSHFYSQLVQDLTEVCSALMFSHIAGLEQVAAYFLCNVYLRVAFLFLRVITVACYVYSHHFVSEWPEMINQPCVHFQYSYMCVWYLPLP